MSDAKFDVGQQVHHKLFNYRGVIFDVDPVFMGTDDWYQQMAKSLPPKDAPWYHVLIHQAEHTTYVAEQNLQAHAGLDGIEHPLLGSLFDGFEAGRYRLRRRMN